MSTALIESRICCRAGVAGSVGGEWPRTFLLRGFGLALLFLATALPVLASDDTDPIDPMTFFLGEWSLVQYDDEGRVVGKATSHAYPILDDTMTQIDYRGLDPKGDVIFRGTTLRTAKPGGGFIVRWAMSNLEGYTYLSEVLRDGVIHGDGHGVDEAGEFLERYRYYDLSSDGYGFQLERSYDAGRSWQKGPRTVATRTR